MAITLSNGALAVMGFRPLGEAEAISAQFHHLHVFAAQGFTLEEPSLPVRSGCINGRTYDLCVGASVNAVCQNLIKDALTENEQDWQREHKCMPPYVMVHLGPSSRYPFEGTHAKFDTTTVHTYDGFTDARVELKAWSDIVLPSLLAGLTSSFSLNDQPVKFFPTYNVFYGITDEGLTVLDTQMMISASAHFSTRLTAVQIDERLDSAVKIAGNVPQKVAKFFNLALNEDDPLKRFLYFFLAVEIETHATFAKINHRNKLLAFVHPPSHATATTQEFFDSQSQRWTNLRDRFVWCVICAWPHLSDKDVDQFKQLKAIRDEIAHGSLATPPYDAVVAIEKLAAHLQLARKPISVVPDRDCL